MVLVNNMSDICIAKEMKLNDPYNTRLLKENHISKHLWLELWILKPKEYLVRTSFTRMNWIMIHIWKAAIYKHQPHFNSFPPSAAYMRQWTGSGLFQVMACRLFGAKPLPEPILVYCYLDSWEQISMKFEFEFYNIYSRKCIPDCCRPRCQPFCPGGDELIDHNNQS